ncbi:alpha/beta hydrolase [Terrimonas sp. NA20]|uniref:Alpha/beta hydrolase n=1 Tax=Terrimonas ginsenosidimutans TaxID=2908004 RepID=A0ABS9KSP4_9BACT|nr:alpha/beta hydrolase [Terrimonas ginsenosidimutans]MCG2615351.1 alpha/beta hydrolase [Terrimonas ginsenosidimutans]
MDSVYLGSVPPTLRSDSVFLNKIDSGFKTDCGYLIVPENRRKKNSRPIRLPYIIVRSKSPDKKKDPVLFTSGGPGNSSLSWAQGITRSSIIETRDCIAFEQRGTKYAIPYLRNTELDSAWHEAYRYNLSIDSMTIVGVNRYKQRLEKRGIDLAGYNSAETVDDIIDLLKLLRIDSINLSGGSYSGGLMTAVARKAPDRVRSMVLDSPLPTFSPIDEDEPVHFMEAMRTLSSYCEKDSADKASYGDLYNRFINYFNSIVDKKFYQPVPDGTVTRQVAYTKNELLQIIVSAILDNNRIKEVPFIVNKLISGDHETYIRPYLERMMKRYPAPDGMRMAVYCADQASYHNPERIQQVYKLYPFLRDYRINDVYKAMCDCFGVPPVSRNTKEAFYSIVPALIADGEMDAACSPLYVWQLRHYFPNSQCFLFLKKGHGVGSPEFRLLTQKFLDDPYQKLEAPGGSIKKME